MSRKYDIEIAEPNDLFQDSKGNMWLVIGRCDVPVIYMQQLALPSQPNSQLRKRDGGITGEMWDGFRKIGHLGSAEMEKTDIKEEIITEPLKE